MGQGLGLGLGPGLDNLKLKVAVAQNNSGHLISVEPDHVVWAVGEFNKVRLWIEQDEVI